jgi:hypothetical protein
VRAERDGKPGDEDVERERRVEVFVLPKKGHAALKRVREESLSIVDGGKREPSSRNNESFDLSK